MEKKNESEALGGFVWKAEKQGNVTFKDNKLMPDESRLLTDEEYCKAKKDAEQEWMWNKRGTNRGRIRAEMMSILEAQRDLTSSIVKKQERERIIKYLDIRFTGYEGNIITGKSRVTFKLPEDWQHALKGDQE